MTTSMAKQADNERGSNTPAIQTVAVTGSSGMVGSELVSQLQAEGRSVCRLVRKPEPGDDRAVRWNVEQGLVDPASLEGIDAVVHLAGENIVAGRWNDKQKARIRDSRVIGTRRLCEDLAKLERKPKVLVCASAIGYYGDRGDEALDESASPADDFLAKVCKGWEDATEPARDAGIRVVNLRIGVVLSPKGGALAKMLTPFKLGVGGKLGSGKQYMSWISLTDLARLIGFCIDNDSAAGPINAVAPNAVTNTAFTKTLGRVLGRPTIFPVPAFAARLAFGEVADALLLASTHVIPEAALSHGFVFEHPTLESALRAELDRPA